MRNKLFHHSLAYSIDEATVCAEIWDFSPIQLNLLRVSGKGKPMNGVIVNNIQSDKYEIAIIVQKLFEGFDYIHRLFCLIYFYIKSNDIHSV